MPQPTSTGLPPGVSYDGPFLGELLCFTDHEGTGSTFSLPAMEATREAIAAKLDEVRSSFAKAQCRDEIAHAGPIPAQHCDCKLCAAFDPSRNIL